MIGRCGMLQKAEKPAPGRRVLLKNEQKLSPVRENRRTPLAGGTRAYKAYKWERTRHGDALKNDCPRPRGKTRREPGL